MHAAPMKPYKHYSFDLWLTLIRSNPHFKLERAKYFHAHFNAKKKSLEEIIAAFRHVDVLCNSMNEKTGGNISAEEMYLMVISLINDNSTDFSGIDCAQLYNEMEALVFKYLPEVYCNDTPNVLSQLKQQSGCTVSILSNTAFIKGRTLREALRRIGLDSHFDFQLYSDETGMSKPNRKLFELMLQNVATARAGGNLLPEEIIHIGDNVLADIGGAQSIGISSLQINSCETRITRLIPA